jgi:formylmethanofuran dehydrogenase subunit A
MDRGFRNERLAQIHPDARAMTTLGTIDREYSLYEIAILTRAGPARTLGLADQGHLGPGAAADVTVYQDQTDRERMFATPEYVFKNGELVARGGEIVKVTWGRCHKVAPAFDRRIERRLEPYFERFLTMRLGNFVIAEDEMQAFGHGAELVTHPCRR